MKKIKKFLAVTLAVVTVFAGMTQFGDLTKNSDAKAKTKAKTINMYKGKTYKINIKKNSKIKLSRKKIISVSKKGKIKALKVGKCTITVKKGKKTWKYNVVVRRKEDSLSNGLPNPLQTLMPTPLPTCAPGGYVMKTGLLVEQIEMIDDKYSYVYLKDDSEIAGSVMPNEKVNTIKIKVSNGSLEKIKEGYGVFILIFRDNTETIEGNTCIYAGVVSIHLYRTNENAKPAPTPIPTPFHCYFPTPKPTPTPTCTPHADA